MRLDRSDGIGAGLCRIKPPEEISVSLRFVDDLCSWARHYCLGPHTTRVVPCGLLGAWT